MSRMVLPSPRDNDARTNPFLARFHARISSFPPGTCPLTVQLALLTASRQQTCDKCVPCRDGIPKLISMLQQLIDGTAPEGILEELRETAEWIRDASDCAIGWQAAADLLEGMKVFAGEYESHARDHRCEGSAVQTVPCIHLCPAHVDIPAYIALIREGDTAGAVAMIRRDNPLPTACAMICEHPCEERCRRRLIDDVINIRGLKKYAVDASAADRVPVPAANPSTGKRVAVIGGGPAGLTAAYFLALMGHKAVIYERHKKLGGMLRYGIPNYRFPKDRLDEDIRAILSAGDIEVHCETNIGTDLTIKEIRESFDAVFVGIGCQDGHTLPMKGSDAKNVESAVQMLDRIGNGELPDYTGKRVVVIGGGNVAMDAARSALRCGASEVTIVYRRRQEDMTALVSEIESAVAEGIELLTLRAPVSVCVDGDGCCSGLVVQPQMAGAYRGGRPAPVKADRPEETLPCEVILIAVGQWCDSIHFEDYGMAANGGILQTGPDTSVPDFPGIFSGGDCATGPATAIRAIAAGKIAAHNIDEYLGYHHTLICDIEVPEPSANLRTPTGRAQITERPARIRKCDFEHVENSLTEAEAMQEAGRCLRCDHFGCGVLMGGIDL